MPKYTYALRGYYRCCNLCGHAFGGPSGARGYIAHLREPSHGYYGHTTTGWKLDCWVWSHTGQERDYLNGLGQSVDHEFVQWRPP